MSCCGGKRAELARAEREGVTDTPEPVDPAPARDRKARTFVYVGDGSLTARGALSGYAYRFAHPGAHVEVAPDDVFGMMAERDVSLLRD